MLTYLFFALFLGTFLALLLVLNAMGRRIAELERLRAEIQVEEDRVFDFLHGLGEAFSEGLRSSDLHRLIVEGAARILEAHGGALYLSGKNPDQLAPAFLSKGCPPLVPVPPEVLEQSATAQPALESFLKLTPVRRGVGPLGQVLAEGKPRIFQREELVKVGLTENPEMAHAVLAAPLIYRRKVLGVLAVANASLSTPFSPADSKVFEAMAEQSAFAIYTETVYLEANEKKRLDHDLEIAREIQSVLLPARPPEYPGFELSSINIPARGVSGDYLDFLELSGGRLGVAIADVSGKGVPAALIMAMCRSVMRGEAAQTASPAEVLRRVNSQLYPDIKEDMFISMAYLVLDSSRGLATLARAGHDAPLLYRAEDRRVEKVAPRGMAVGIDSGEVFNRVIEDFEFSLAPGDCLLFYTDGATEALDVKGMEFGLGRLAQCLQSAAPQGAHEVVAQVTEEIRAFVGSASKHDDITLIAIKKT